MISRRQLLALIAATPAALAPKWLMAGWEPLPSTREWLAKQAVIRLHEALITRGFTIDLGTEFPRGHWRYTEWCDSVTLKTHRIKWTQRTAIDESNLVYSCDDVQVFDLDRAVTKLVDKLTRFESRTLRFFQDPDTTDARIWYRGIHLGADVFKSDQGPEVAIIKVFPVGL